MIGRIPVLVSSDALSSLMRARALAEANAQLAWLVEGERPRNTVAEGIAGGSGICVEDSGARG